VRATGAQTRGHSAFLAHRYMEAASWYIWFVASASYTLGLAYQLQAMVCAADETRFVAALLACPEAPAYL